MERLISGIYTFKGKVEDVENDYILEVQRKLKEYEDLEEQWKLIKLPCNLRDTVFDVVLCDDEKYHILPMKVCNINPFGDMRKGRVWNIYLENEYSKAYRSFYDFGKTIFTTRNEAEEALKRMEAEKAHAEEKEQPETE